MVPARTRQILSAISIFFFEFVAPLCDRPGRERFARGVTPGLWLPLNLFLGIELCWPMRPPRTLHLTLVLPGVAVLDGWRESPTKRDFGFVSIHGFGFSMLSRPFLPFYCTVLGDGIGIGLPGFGNEKEKRERQEEKKKEQEEKEKGREEFL